MISYAPPLKRRPHLRASLMAPSLASAPELVKKHAPEVRSGAASSLGQPQRRLVVEGRARRDEGAGLRGEGVHHRGRAVAQAVDRPALDEVEIALAGVVDEPGPSALDEDDLRPLGDLHQASEVHHAPFRSARRASTAVSRRARARAVRASRVAMKMVSSPAMAPTASGSAASSRARASGAAAAGGVFSDDQACRRPHRQREAAQRAPQPRVAPRRRDEAGRAPSGAT